MEYSTELETTINDMVQKGRGILAADESSPTIAKRFKAIGVESTEAYRRAWRSLLVTTEGLGEYISGIILFEETLGQDADEGKSIPEAAWAQKIVPGIKVDKGKIPLALSPGDLITQGLDGLAERLRSYKQQGARFAKWREVYSIDKQAPSLHGIEANAEMLARYAAVCQSEGLVPIVEPEVLMDGGSERTLAPEYFLWPRPAANRVTGMEGENRECTCGTAGPARTRAHESSGHAGRVSARHGNGCLSIMTGTNGSAFMYMIPLLDAINEFLPEAN